MANHRKLPVSGGLIKKELDRPLFPNRSNFFKYTFLITLGVIVTLVLVVAFGEGDNFIERLGDSYKSIYNTTIDGTPWTHIMRATSFTSSSPRWPCRVISAAGWGWVSPTGRS